MEETDYRESYEREHLKCAELAGRIADLEAKNEELEWKLNRIKNNPLWKASRPARDVLHWIIRQRDRLRNCGGPRGVLHKVRILGPERPEAQVELAQTDCRVIGVQAPVRASGHVEGTPGVLLQGPRGVFSLPRGVIVADRHLHMSTAQAAAFGLSDGDTVRVRVEGGKPGILDGVLVRAGERYELDLHLDTDDANAFQLRQGQLVTVLE